MKVLLNLFLVCYKYSLVYHFPAISTANHIAKNNLPFRHHRVFTTTILIVVDGAWVAFASQELLFDSLESFFLSLFLFFFFFFICWSWFFIFIGFLFSFLFLFLFISFIFLLCWCLFFRRFWRCGFCLFLFVF